MPSLFRFAYMIRVVFLLLSVQSSLQQVNITNNIFGGQASGWTLGAIADFNGDRSTDVMVINEKKNAFGVILMQPYGYTQSAEMYRESFVLLFAQEDIVSVMPGDINGDHNMDFYVVANKRLLVYYCNCNTTNGKLLGCPEMLIRCNQGKIGTYNSVPIADEPLFADINGDWLPDVIFTDDVSNDIQIYVGALGQTSVNKISETTVFAPQPPVIRKSKLFQALFASFNQDMAADILIDRSVYLYDGTIFRYDGELPPLNATKAGLPNIISINNPTQALEFIIPVCQQSIPNASLEVCGNAGLQRLAYPSNKWTDLPVFLPSGYVDFAWIFPKEDISNPSSRLVTQFMPLPQVRAGDFNLDGFTDLVAVVALKATNSIAFSAPIIATFVNVACNSGRCYQLQQFLSFNGQVPVVATFIDYTPTGRLAVLATLLNETSGSTNLIAVTVKVDADLAFLKMSISDTRSFEEFTAVNMPGATVSCQIASQLSRVAILPSSAHSALYMPYSIFGLGQLPPYVDELAVQLTSRTVRRYFTHSFIIPNSQLVLIPIPPDEPDLWQLQSFLLINWYLFAVLILIGVLTFSSIVMLGGLQIRDKQIEKREKEEEAQHFHFDGM